MSSSSYNGSSHSGDAGHDDFLTLQRLVADRHDVLLGRNDPIAMLQTSNELLVQRMAAALEQAQTAALTKFCHELEQSAAEWKREANEVGARTLEAARRISTGQIEQATAQLLQALALERERSQASLRRAHTLNAVVLLAAALTLVGTLWLHLHPASRTRSSSGSSQPAQHSLSSRQRQRAQQLLPKSQIASACCSTPLQLCATNSTPRWRKSRPNDNAIVLGPTHSFWSESQRPT